MSLILDALRKSEAERRRGQSPDLFGPPAPVPSHGDGRARAWPLLLLGAMLLGSAWLIWDSGPREAPAPVDASGDRSATDAPADRDPRDRSTIAATGADAGASVASAAPLGETPAMAVAPAPPPPSRADRSSPAPAEPPAREDVAQAVASTAPAQEPPPPPPPADEALPPVAALDAASRAALPALRLSMHVYADEPSRRFAIVDGQRVGEGAVLGAGHVAQIRRDGVVIEVNGRRVLLPKP